MSKGPAYQVEHLGLPAKNPEALAAWYRDVLGGNVMFENRAVPAFYVRISGGLILEIYPSTGAREETRDNGLAGWRHLALRVEGIEPAREKLEKLGVRFSEPVKPAGGGGRVLFFQDPEGNLLHLVERPADSVFLSK